MGEVEKKNSARRNIYKAWLAAKINTKRDMSDSDYLLNIGEDKFCFSSPEDLSVRDYFF